MGAGSLARHAGRRNGNGGSSPDARRRSQIAWDDFAVLVATGTWNIAAEQDKITGNYPTTLIAKLATVLVPGVTAFSPARAAPQGSRCPAPSPAPARWPPCSGHPAGKLSPSSHTAPRGLRVTVPDARQSRSSLARTAASLILGRLVAVSGVTPRPHASSRRCASAGPFRRCQFRLVAAAEFPETLPIVAMPLAQPRWRRDLLAPLAGRRPGLGQPSRPDPAGRHPECRRLPPGPRRPGTPVPLRPPSAASSR